MHALQSKMRTIECLPSARPVSPCLSLAPPKHPMRSTLWSLSLGRCSAEVRRLMTWLAHLTRKHYLAYPQCAGTAARELPQRCSGESDQHLPFHTARESSMCPVFSSWLWVLSVYLNVSPPSDPTLISPLPLGVGWLPTP